MNIIESQKNYTQINTNRLDFIYNTTINAIANNLHDVLYNIIIEWHWIDYLLINSEHFDQSNEKLTDLLQLVKDHNYNFEYYQSFNCPANFSVYNNIRDLYEIHNKYSILDVVEPAEPTESAESTESAEPTESAESAESTESAESAESAEHAEHAESAESAEHAEHAESAESAESAEHAEPAESAESDEIAIFNNESIDDIMDVTELAESHANSINSTFVVLYSESYCKPDDYNQNVYFINETDINLLAEKIAYFVKSMSNDYKYYFDGETYYHYSKPDLDYETKQHIFTCKFSIDGYLKVMVQNHNKNIIQESFDIDQFEQTLINELENLGMKCDV